MLFSFIAGFDGVGGSSHVSANFIGDGDCGSGELLVLVSGG